MDEVNCTNDRMATSLCFSALFPDLPFPFFVSLWKFNFLHTFQYKVTLSCYIVLFINSLKDNNSLSLESCYKILDNTLKFLIISWGDLALFTDRFE